VVAPGISAITDGKELDEMAEKSSGADFIAGFLVGALVGAAAALLLAPHSGEETRTLIREKGIELGDRADELSLEARRRAEDLQVQAKGKADEWQTKMQQAVEEGKATATKTKEDLLSKVSQEQAAEETLADT
jgi:gas vesicle protein